MSTEQNAPVSTFGTSPEKDCLVFGATCRSHESFSWLLVRYSCLP